SKAGAKVAAKVAARAVPGLGTAMLVKDSYDLAKAAYEATTRKYDEERMANFKAGRGYRVNDTETIGEFGDRTVQSERRSFSRDLYAQRRLIRERSQQDSSPGTVMPDAASPPGSINNPERAGGIAAKMRAFHQRQAERLQAPRQPAEPRQNVEGYWARRGGKMVWNKFSPETMASRSQAHSAVMNSY
ncbi:MAG TPA: IgG-binding virulence factor TspB family protein, partial [Hyphomicrobiales bacterium]|nr:IgG-binding virulence factor TspB family protein [Hyphomicrobiales bacterium]